MEAAMQKDDVDMSNVAIKCYATRNMATAKSLRKAEVSNEQSSYTLGLRPMRSTSRDIDEGGFE